MFRILSFGLRAYRAVLRRLGQWMATRLHGAALGALGARSVIQAGVVISPANRVQIGNECLIWRGVGMSAESVTGALRIADRVQINCGAHLDFTGGLTIADDVLISQDTVLYTHDHGRDPHAPPELWAKSIGAGAWIGMRAVILPHCQAIGAGAVIGAGAIVTSDVPAGAVVAGNPARIIGQRDIAKAVA